MSWFSPELNGYTENACLSSFKMFKDIPALYKNKVAENEQVWFQKVLPAVNIVSKYLEV